MADGAVLQDWQSSRLPWSRVPGERGRFVGTLALMVLVFLPPAFLIPAMDLPERDRIEIEEVPPRLAKLVAAHEVENKGSEERLLLTPELESPPKSEDLKKGSEESVLLTPELKSPPKSEELKKGSDESLHLTPGSPPAPSGRKTAEQARETASRSGLLAMKDRLASLRESPSKQAPALTANVAATSLSSAQSDQSDVLKGSGGVEAGVNPAAEVSVADHQVKKVERITEPAEQTVARAKATEAKPTAGQRAMSNIRKVFDAQKTALYSLYRRELRQDPTLQGKVLLELVIEPDGSVSACKVVSSELENRTLEQRIAMRVRMFNFGEDSVERRKVRFPVDFLPG